MNKIKAFGLTVLTGTVLALGSPVAGYAQTPSTTPNRDAFCAAENVPATITTLTDQLAEATDAHDDAVAAVVVEDADMVAATSALADAVLAHITAQDGSNASELAIAENTYNVRAADFAKAASDWLNAHIAEVNAQNSVTGTTFLLNYATQVAGKVCPAPAA